MNYFLAIFPILIILFFMIVLRWGGQKAGPVGWLTGIVVAVWAFGLNLGTFWVSQAKGLLLTLYVLMVLWPALLLYNTIKEAGGIRALATGLENLICDPEILLITLAWAFSALLEGLAGFGIPVAVVSPMLVTLGVSPVLAVAAVAIGHSWAVTFGDMGVIFQTLIGVSQMTSAEVVIPAAIVLGISCSLCGLAVWHLIRTNKNRLGEPVTGPWSVWKILAISIVMASVQYLLAIAGLVSISGLGAGVSGVVTAIAITRNNRSKSFGKVFESKPFRSAVFTYGGLAAVMALLALPGPLHAVLYEIAWKPAFPAVTTAAVTTAIGSSYPSGFTTQAGYGQVFRWILHPGISILAVTSIAYLIFRRKDSIVHGSWWTIISSTYRSAFPVSIGILFTVCLSTLMDHTGMTMLLANGLSTLFQSAYPAVSPLVGMLGAFATGSNNNSNVLFASLQKNVALLLNIAPAWLLAAQTAGGSLGSMIAPAKIIVGCSTVGLTGKEDGEVLKMTLPYGLGIGIFVGVIVLAILSIA
jgi:lactate permease